LTFETAEVGHGLQLLIGVCKQNLCPFKSRFVDYVKNTFAGCLSELDFSRSSGTVEEFDNVCRRQSAACHVGNKCKCISDGFVR